MQSLIHLYNQFHEHILALQLLHRRSTIDIILCM